MWGVTLLYHYGRLCKHSDLETPSFMLPKSCAASTQPDCLLCPGAKTTVTMAPTAEKLPVRPLGAQVLSRAWTPNSSKKII